MRRLLCGLILGFGCSSLLLGAEDQRLRLQIGHVSSVSGLFNSGGVTVGADSALGVRLSFEYLFTDSFGLEAGLATSQHDYTLMIVNGVRRGSDFRMTPLTLMGNLHVGDSRRVDSFFGAGLAYVTFGDFAPLGGSVEVSVDPGLTWVVQYGMDISLGKLRRSDLTRKPWSLGLAVSYLNVDADVGSRPLPIETINIYAGLVWHWK